MSLIHWWPLDGDTKDYGLNPKHGTLLGDASVTSTAGKVSLKCLSAGIATKTINGVSVPCNLIDELSSEYSLSVWIKPNGTHVNYNGAIISSGNWNNKCWSFGVSQDNSQIDVFSNTYNRYITLPSALTTGTWYHIVSVQKDGVNKVYLNGVLVGSLTIAALYQTDATNLTIGRETYASGYFSFNGNINDLRIYDHALSLKEIENLSNSCILHYNFEDPGMDSATNILTGLGSGGRTTVNNGVLTVSGLNSDTYFSLKLPTGGMTAGETYTLSCDAELPEGTRWRFGLGHQSTSYPNFIIYNGHNSYTFVAESTYSAGKTSITMDDILESTYSPRALYTGVETRMYNFQLTKTNYDVPYLGGFSASKEKDLVFDCSGFQNNSNASSTFSIKKDTTAKGELVGVFNGSSYLTRSALPSTTQTITAWVKVDTYPTSNQVVFADYSSKLSFGFYSSSYGIITCGDSVRYVSNLKTLWNTSGWNHVAVTKDNSGTFHCYINGTECSYTGSNTWTHNGNYFTVGCRYNSSFTTNFTGQIADIKAYVTALTQSEIQSECRSQLRFLNNHIVEAQLINETSKNMAWKMNDAIFNKTFSNGVSKYTQAHCQVTLTDNGLRIYRTPNLTQANDGNVMYGGMKLNFLSLGNTRTITYTNTSTNTELTYSASDFFMKDHTYKISFHVSGFTHQGAASLNFTNNMGWGGGGLNPSPTVIDSKSIPSNFGISNNQAVGDETDCYYIFKIEDDIYKPCTKAYSSFVLGNMYPSYRDFQLQFGYGSTGTNGTDLYITNIVCEDITDEETLVNPNAQNGIMNAFSINERTYTTTPVSFSDCGNLTATSYVESSNILGNSVVREKLNSRATVTNNLKIKNTETKILEGTIANNTSSEDIVTAAQVIEFINSLKV